MRNGGEGWSLEVIDHEGASNVWDDIFATDEDAHREFHRTLEQEGIRTFLTAYESRRSTETTGQE